MRFNSNQQDEHRKSSVPAKLNVTVKQRKSNLNQSYTADSKSGSVRTKKKKPNITNEI